MITLARIIEALEPRALTRIPAAVLAREVTAVTADSRRVVPGSLFVAVRGEKADGRAFIPEAVRRGCLAVAVEEGADIDALAVPVLVNVWNFMDGIDGLAASQAALCAAALTLLVAGGWGLLAVVLCATCVGFLPFNLPRARIFLGDVGSGALGYVLAALVVAGL